MTGFGRAALLVSYSTASAEAVTAFVAAHYDLGAPSPACALLNCGFNDTYVLRTGAGERFVLRLSSRRARSPADVAAETEFLAYRHEGLQQSRADVSICSIWAASSRA